MITPTSQDLEVHGNAQSADPFGSHALKKSYDMRPAMPSEPPPLGWFSRLRYDFENYHLQKGVQDSYLKAQQKAYEAATQGTVISPALDAWGMYDTPSGVTEPTGQTFALLRAFAHRCEPVGAIHNKRIEQIAAFCVPAESRWGKNMSPGFRIRMTRRDAPATPADREEIEKIGQFFLEGGYCPPPAEERPLGWQPGLEPFVRALMRDQLTMDHVAVRTWKSSVDGKKYPIVSFAAVDAGLIRNKRRIIERIDHNVVQFSDQENERQNIKKSVLITHVKMDSDVGGREMEEYTDDELFTAFMRPRTDEEARGYGYSVLEQAMTAITVWCAARDMNALRFDRDSTPRGILTLFGNMNPQQFNKFVQDWKNMMQGLRNRHTIPILQGSPVTGSSVKYEPLDPNPRDMEYSQFTFAVGLWIHCLYGIHPDETGFSASSPFRPPLSEASPEANLTYSQDTGLSPLLRWLEGVLNRHILWRMYPDRRYTFEFVGMGDYNKLDDVNERMASMQACLTTPLMNWNELDITGEIDKQWLDHPAAKMPGLFSQNIQLLLTMQQSQQQSDQADQQQQMAQQQQGEAADQQDHEQDMDKADQEQEAAGAEHSQNMDKFKAGLEQSKMLAEQQAQAGGGEDQASENKSGNNKSGNSVDRPQKTGYNTIANKQQSSDGPERAPGFMDRPGSGQRFGGGASTRPVAKKPIGKAVSGGIVDIAAMQRILESGQTLAKGVSDMAAERKARRLGQIVIRK